MTNIKQYISFCFLLGLLVIPSMSLIAQDSLEKYLETAAANNPELKAAYNRYLAALEKIPQAGSLPDPQASFGYFIKPMQLPAGNRIANFHGSVL